MIWYEWKRIWMSRLTQLTVIGCSIFFLLTALGQIRFLSATDSNGNQIYGMNAVEVLKENQKSITLDQKTVTAVMGQYLEYTNNPSTSSENPDLKYLSEDVYRKWYLPNQDLILMISRSCQDRNRPEETIKDIFARNLDRDFYKARKASVDDTLDVEVNKNVLTQSEVKWWNEQEKYIGQLSFGYCQTWEQILSTSSLLLLIMMVVCIGIAPIFAGEYQTKSDSILLCMRYGRSRLIISKAVASILYSSVVYWGIILFYIGIYIITLGAEGWDVSIQSYRYLREISSYNLTIGAASGILVLMGYAMTLGITGIVLLLSSLFKNAYGVIITVFLIILVPLFLSLASGGYMWQHILGILPGKISEFNFGSHMVYSLGGMTVTWPVAAVVINCGFAIIFTLMGCRFFSKHQVNK